MEESAIDVGAYLIDIFITNIKVFCKDTIENLTKDCPASSYLVLRRKPMVPGGRLLIDIGYKYDTCKVLFFIVLEKKESIQAGLQYLSK